MLFREIVLKQSDYLKILLHKPCITLFEALALEQSHVFLDKHILNQYQFKF